jgi:uncharacterized protein
MKIKQLFLTFFLLATTVTPVCADDFDDGVDAYKKGNYHTALEKFKQSVEQGVKLAFPYLGTMYEFGWGVEKNDREALKWHKRGVNWAYPESLRYVAMRYENGEGLPQDYKEAFNLYEFGAIIGDSFCEFKVGVMYSKGLGTTQDYVLAHKWFNVAGANDNEDARKQRDILQKIMTPAQIAKAQKLAREWWKGHQKK